MYLSNKHSRNLGWVIGAVVLAYLRTAHRTRILIYQDVGVADEIFKWAEKLGDELKTVHQYSAIAAKGSMPNTRNRLNLRTASTTLHLRIHRVPGGGSLAATASTPVASFSLAEPLDVAKLLPYCRPAPFGDLDTQTTVIDPSVRSALELPALDHLSPSATPLPDEPQYAFELCWVTARTNEHGKPGEPTAVSWVEVQERRMQETIQALLTPSDVRFVPYKLSIYGPGDFFKPHVDTPVIEPSRMLGTAVVCLPSAFKGGDLVIRPPSGSDTAGSSGTRLSPAEPASGSGPVTVSWQNEGDLVKKGLPYVAFFGDCDHEVQPVTEGQRVTLALAMLAEEKKEKRRDRYGDDVDDGGDKCQADALKSIVQQLQHRPALAETAGILLSHKYTASAMEEGVECMKGSDRLLIDTIRKAGMDAQVVPVAYVMRRVRHHDENHQDFIVDDVISFTRAELQRQLVLPPHDDDAFEAYDYHSYTFEDDDDDDEIEPTDAPEGQKSDDVVFVVKTGREIYDPPSPGHKLWHEEREHAKRTGNSSEPGREDAIYLCAGVIITGRGTPTAA